MYTIFLFYSKDVNGIDVTACIRHVEGCDKVVTESSTESQITTTGHENGGITTKMSSAIFSLSVSLFLFFICQ